MDWDRVVADRQLDFLKRRVDDLEKNLNAMRVELIAAGQYIRKLKGKDDPMLVRLREALKIGKPK